MTRPVWWPSEVGGKRGSSAEGTLCFGVPLAESHVRASSLRGCASVSLASEAPGVATGVTSEGSGAPRWSRNGLGRLTQCPRRSWSLGWVPAGTLVQMPASRVAPTHGALREGR